MRILVLQESDWIERGPHQSHHLLERLVQRGHEARVIDFEIGWRQVDRIGIIAPRKILKPAPKVIEGSSITVLRPAAVRLPIFEYASSIVTHGFEIHCNASDLPNNIEVNWNSGDHFHLTTLVSVSCTDNPSITPENPAAPCDTITGTGVGRYDGVDGATIQFTFTDAGEPGTNDRAVIRIYDASGTQVLDTNSPLTGGNQQAHGG